MRVTPAVVAEQLDKGIVRSKYIAVELQVSESTVNNKLSVLKRLGLAQTTPVGNHRHWHLTKPLDEVMDELDDKPRGFMLVNFWPLPIGRPYGGEDKNE